MDGTDDVMASELAAVNRGRLARLKFKRNLAAREASLATIRRWPDGKWTARIGGRLRGYEVAVSSRALAEQRVNDHYNEVMLRWVQQGAKK